MSYLFYFDERAKLFLRPEAVKLCPELSALDQEELLFVVKAFDDFSPLRRYPEPDRIRRAMLDVWKDNKPKILAALEKSDPHDYMVRAVEAYKSLQYDEKRELIKQYQQAIEDTKQTITSDLTDKQMKEKLSNISELRKHIKSLENEITEQVIEEGQIKADQELTFVENLQRNKQMYEYVTTRRK